MRVLLIHNHFRVIGGAEVFYHDVGRVLESQGHEVAYLSPADPAGTPESPWRAFFPAAADYRRGSIASRVWAFPRMVYSLEAKRACARLLAEFRPDVVHSFAVHVRLTPSVLDACREARVPVVMSCNDYKHLCPNSKLYTRQQLCERCRDRHFYHAIRHACLHDSTVFSVAGALEAYVHAWRDSYRRNVHTFLFASRFMAAKTEEFWGAGTFRWRLLRNPFDSPGHAPRTDHGDYLLYFGRLSHEKGVDVLIRAMRACPGARLKIVGDGPVEEAMRRLCAELGTANIEFLGARWGSELESVLGAARFVVVPSTWHENFPYVIFQSFATGKAVIGSRVGGIPELIEDGVRGLTYPAHDERALADRITRLWQEPDTAVAMGRRAKSWADEEFNDAAFYQTLMDIYGSLGARTRTDGGERRPSISAAGNGR